eukprot:scaffold15166_cov140-Isochrysis_galbana.AAC.1
MAQPPSRVRLAYPSTSTSTGVPATTSHRAGMTPGVVQRGGEGPRQRTPREDALLRRRGGAREAPADLFRDVSPPLGNTQQRRTNSGSAVRR